jgi:hypothetical protein
LYRHQKSPKIGFALLLFQIITLKFTRLPEAMNLIKRKLVHFSIPVAALFMMIFIEPAMLFGQPGGKAFQFLEITNSARVAALGGDVVASHDNDPELAYHNPSLLSLDMHHHMTLNYVNYFAGANFGYASVAARLDSLSSLACGIHYLYYGTFQGADESGIKTGNFRAADYSVNVMYSRKLDSLFTLGFTFKNVYSDYESYNSTAIAIDAGITYHNRPNKFTAGLVIRNLGMQVDSYTANDAKEPLPFNIAVGISKGLAHAPLTFSLVFNHIEKWDLTYKTEAEKDEEENLTLTGNPPSADNKFDVFFDQLMRHFIAGTTLHIGKNLEFRAGYNYRRRQELKIDAKPAMVGFSWGLGVNLNKFRVAYGRSVYHLAGATNHFSFSMNLDEFSKKF